MATDVWRDIKYLSGKKFDDRRTVMMLEYLYPMRAMLSRIAVWLLALLVLVIAQSKTAWAAAALIGAVLAWYRWARDQNGRVRIGFVLAGIAMSLLLCVGIWGNAVWHKVFA